jgi:hypothetical protein
MRVGEIRTLIEDKGDEELVFAPWFDKDEAEEHIQNNLMEDFGKSNDVTLTANEWELIVNKMSNDDGIWNELYESFKYYIEQVIESREKGEANDDSK